jgi:20S proteasome subunit alpha 6
MFRNQYDTDVTTWSPQGRLFQVEYAMEAVKQGSACVGLKSDSHVVLAAIKRSPSELASFQKKIFEIDGHMGIAISGLTSDARSLSKHMRTECLNHKFVYGSDAQVGRIVADVADKHQQCTQSYVRRPYGVGMLVAGYDRTGSHLYQTSPSGNYYDFKSMAIGARSQAARTYLEKHFEGFAPLSRDALIKHALRALNGCLEAEGELKTENTTIAFVGKDCGFTVLEDEAVAPFLATFEAEDESAGDGSGDVEMES